MIMVTPIIIKHHILKHHIPELRNSSHDTEHTLMRGGRLHGHRYL